MLAIRLQRMGRSGHAQFRVVVQDSRRSPKRGKVVAYLGSYNPHTKEANLDKDKAQTFLNNGAQPSERAAGLLKTEGVKLPKWVTKTAKKQGKIRNPEKLRKNRPAEPVEAETPAPTEAVEAEVSDPETPAEPATETKASSEGTEPTEAEAEPTESAS